MAIGLFKRTVEDGRHRKTSTHSNRDTLGPCWRCVQWWRNVSGGSRPGCSINDCQKDGSHGSHVKIVGSSFEAAFTPGAWWIIPACAEHNKGGSWDTYRVKHGTVAVEADPGFEEKFQRFHLYVDRAVRETQAHWNNGPGKFLKHHF